MQLSQGFAEGPIVFTSFFERDSRDGECNTIVLYEYIA